MGKYKLAAEVAQETGVKMEEALKAIDDVGSETAQKWIKRGKYSALMGGGGLVGVKADDTIEDLTGGAGLKVNAPGNSGGGGGGGDNANSGINITGMLVNDPAKVVGGAILLVVIINTVTDSTIDNLFGGD